MGNSLDFIKNRISSGVTFGMDLANFEGATEFSFESFISTLPQEFKNYYSNGEIKTILYGTQGEKRGSMSVVIKYSPSETFEYFTLKECVCDGTFLFASQLMEEILNSLLGVQAYNSKTIPEEALIDVWGYNVIYTIGDFVFNIENGDFGTEDKPWLHSRFTMMLPLKCEWIKK